MADINYLLHESSVGYAIFEVVNQGDAIGNRLKEVQDATLDLAKFGKMVKLVNFAPYRYTQDFRCKKRRGLTPRSEELPKLSRTSI